VAFEAFFGKGRGNAGGHQNAQSGENGSEHLVGHGRASFHGKENRLKGKFGYNRLVA
jgi:hypothetical protein